MSIKLDKITLAAIVEENGGKISKSQLETVLISKGGDPEQVKNAVNDFTKGRLVNFDGENISFV